MTPQRVVFDCNVLFQALVSRRGPARACVVAADEKRATLILSQYILDELHNVASRNEMAVRFDLTDEQISAFLAKVRRCATLIDDIPHIFELPRDPKDAHYVDLAVAANAKLIVSRDDDLLTLNDRSTEAGRDFAARIPGLEILTPPQLLALLADAPNE